MESNQTNSVLAWVSTICSCSSCGGDVLHWLKIKKSIWKLFDFAIPCLTDFFFVLSIKLIDLVIPFAMTFVTLWLILSNSTFKRFRETELPSRKAKTFLVVSRRLTENTVPPLNLATVQKHKMSLRRDYLLSPVTWKIALLYCTWRRPLSNSKCHISSTQAAMVWMTHLIDVWRLG